MPCKTHSRECDFLPTDRNECGQLRWHANCLQAEMVKVLDLDQKCRRFDTLALVELSSYVSFLTVRRKLGLC